MARRVCAYPGCPRLIPKGASRCPEHARPSPTERGYDAHHRTLRAHYQGRMEAGETFACWRCGQPVDPTEWDLGHVHDERDTPGRRAKRWPEHRRECNRRAAGKSSATARNV